MSSSVAKKAKSAAAAASSKNPDPEMTVDDTSSLLRGQTHSRESSGASNLSVKFTITQSSDGGSPVASATVSSNVSPDHVPGGASGIADVPAVAVRRGEINLRRKKRTRRLNSSAEVEVDSLSPDEGDGPDNKISMEYGKSCESLDNDRLMSNNERMLQGDSKSQNSDYGSFCNTSSNTYLNSNGSKVDSTSETATKRPSGAKRTSAPPTAEAVGPGAEGRNSSSLNQSVISTETYQTQPLLDQSASDSSCSDDDAGANSSGYTRRKTRHHGAKSQAPAVTRDVRIEVETDADETNFHFPGEPLKTFLAFVFFFFALVVTMTSLAITHDRVPKTPPLPDVFLDNVTVQPWGLTVSENIIIVSTLIAFIVVIFHKHRCIVLRRLFLIAGLHYYYRAVTMFITVLPVVNPEYKCAPQLNSTDVTPLIIAQRVLKLLSGFGLSMNGKHVYCGDYIYSGHTMTLVMTYLVIKGYSPKRWFLLHYASLCLSIAGVLFLLLGRGHYSIDVVVAYWITTRVWWIFHTMANNTNMKENRNGNNFLRKMWWWHIFLYFEINIPRSVPREYNLPIPDKILRMRPFAYLTSRSRRNEESGSGDAGESRDVESGEQ